MEQILTNDSNVELTEALTSVNDGGAVIVHEEDVRYVDEEINEKYLETREEDDF